MGTSNRIPNGFLLGLATTRGRIVVLIPRLGEPWARHLGPGSGRTYDLATPPQERQPHPLKTKRDSYMSASQASLYGSVVIDPSTSDAEAALSVLLFGLDVKTKDACMRPESLAMRLSVEESKRSVDVLESALLALTTAVRNRVAGFRTRQNDLMPFNSLPTELVADILVASIPSENDKGYSETDAVGVSRLQQLASVCRRWRDSVKTCPQLWTVLGTREPNLVALKLKRSGSLPLTIKIPWPPSLTIFKNFLSVVTNHSHRWSSAHISYDDVSVEGTELQAIDITSHTLGLPMPTLQYLRLHLVRRTWEEGSSLDLSRLTDAPLLRHLHLSYISPLGLPSHTCSTLRTLHISDLRHTENAVHMLMDTLSMCTQLKNLELCQNSCPSTGDIQMPGHGPKVHLPNLERLGCWDNYEYIPLLLLSTICAEKLSWLRIHDSSDGKAIFREILRSRGGPSLLSTVLANSGRTSLYMTVGYGLEVQTKLPRNKGVDIRVGQESPWQEHIVHLLKEHSLPSNTPPIDLQIYDSSHNIGEEVSLVVDLLKITQTITQISTLSLHCGISNIRKFFTALLEANDPDVARQISNLTNVILPGVLNDAECEDLKPMIHALETRYVDSGITEELPFKVQYEARPELVPEKEWSIGDGIGWEVAREVSWGW